MTDAGHPLPPNLGAYVARRVMSGATPGYAYWEQPDEAWDSGWRVFVGDETQVDAEEPNNFQIKTLQSLLAEHPGLGTLFIQGRQGSWEWDTELEEFRPAPEPDQG